MATAKGEPLDMKLEVVVLGVSDVDRAKAFYENLGWRLDADFARGCPPGQTWPTWPPCRR
jgi:catechol 2,3-dioxygenase-like lactoylglutathione lyase family enzyme